ncbi:MAG: ABC transporter permease [Pseudonocardiaceae bacterium]
MTNPTLRATATQPATDHPGGASEIDVCASRLDRASADMRTAAMIWRREMTRFVRARSRIITSLAQPVLFLFVLGVGLTPLVGPADGLNFIKFIFPGVIAISVVTTAILSAASIVWDREFGFLREMLVAPVSRACLVIGMSAGGASVAVIQGLIMLVFVPVVGIRLTALTVLQTIGIMLLMAFTVTTLGVFLAALIQKIETFQTVVQFLLVPMLFLSSALFPLHGLPAWLSVITRLNPLTYIVDPLRRVVLTTQDLPTTTPTRYGFGVELFGTVVPTWAELLITFTFAVMFLGAAIRAFRYTE